ncbi:MAG: outer membrane protein assembly factor BamD [Balneolaceae bacterium]|nr:outer membrane protein assembly factor BamD [Balneolaceae bacterium]
MQSIYTKSLLLSLLATMLLASCTKRELIRQGDSLEVAYEKALALYEDEHYADAARAFETVIQIGLGTDYGRHAQYYLAESYYNDRRYLLAATEYERFISQFPRSERREEVQFKEAYCYYQLSPRYRLDQEYTYTAIEKLRIFNSNFSDSDRTQEAAQYISDLRAKLARKQYNAGDLYMRMREYEAAIIYFDLTIENYPDTPWAEQALVDEINAYNIYASRSVEEMQRPRYESAVEAYETYVQLFPNGENRSLAEQYVDNARSALSSLPGAPAADSVGADNRPTP